MRAYSGFSKLNKTERIQFLKENIPLEQEQIDLLSSFHLGMNEQEEIIENLSENRISNYILPFSVAPNFLINEKLFFVPMVTEESSVVAAASFAAKFWSTKGGFKTEVSGTTKTGQIYFTFNGSPDKFESEFSLVKNKLLETVKPLIENMESRGGGISGISLIKKGNTNHHTISVEFETVDSMGANLINSCLETMAAELVSYFKNNNNFPDVNPEIIMAILSNYTPDCLVECRVECKISDLAEISGNLSPVKFAAKFEKAVQIADEEISRAVTHNKGIFNGIDAVLIATGNDFRAVEACGHAYAARDGAYRSLTHIGINNNIFTYSLRIPIPLGTIGGAASIHPLARLAMKIIKNPTARELMQIVAAAGLACNFSAIRSLITEGIQKGHMKLHLSNILKYFNATEAEETSAEQYFRDRQYSFKAVSDYLTQRRERDEKGN